jgi:hypothetical protein
VRVPTGAKMSGHLQRRRRRQHQHQHRGSARSGNWSGGREQVAAGCYFLERSALGLQKHVDDDCCWHGALLSGL